MTRLFEMYAEAINKPRIYQTVSDEAIILLVPCLVVIAMIVIFCIAVWIIKKIISFAKKIQEQEEARLEAANALAEKFAEQSDILRRAGTDVDTVKKRVAKLFAEYSKEKEEENG